MYDVIGSRAAKLDGPDKATGRARYADDLSFPGMLYGAILQSPIAHGIIKNIDISRALKLKGVRAVLTGADLEPIRYGVSPARYDEFLLARDKVRYVGDEVACVAAEDRETAQAALGLIRVDYQELPAVFDPFEAMADGAPQLHDEFPFNICAEVHQEFGDVEAAFKQCDFIHEHRFVNKRQDAAFIEPHAAVAVYDLGGRLTLYSATQVPHYVQRTVAMVTGVPVGRVRVVKPYVGGGFGPKAEATPVDMCSCLLAMKTGRPVKITYSREQVFLHSRARHQFIHELKTGVKRDGTVLALHNRCWLDGGAYSSFGIATVYYAGSLLGGPYRLPHMKYDGWRLYTNKPACGAQRGHGGVAARAAWEQQLDMIAAELDMDPIDLRLRNIMETGDVTCNDLAMSSLGMKECLEAVREKSGWREKRGRLPRGRGLGVSCGFFVSGAGYPIYRSDTYHSTVVVRVAEDGGVVTVQTGSADIGQGSDTAMAMIAAEALGIPLEAVRVVSGDTDLSVDLGAYSSRQTLMTGHATKEAAEDVKRQILEVLAAKTGRKAADFDFKQGRLTVKGAPLDITPIRTMYIKEHRGWGDPPTGDQLTFREVARLAYLERGSIAGTGKYKPPALGGKFKGAAVGTSPAYGCSAQVVEVEVDEDTGQVKVVGMTDAHDCGRAINRTSVEGQMEGSLCMGLGEALFEEVKFDPRGRVLNANLGEYKIPTALDMPNVKSIIIESGEPNGPFGAKEVGEGAIMPTIPAILNAIANAVGVRVAELPASAERVYMALKQKDSK
jgi:4-hydroxybenzoyl-CoA reductase alpha subunit